MNEKKLIELILKALEQHDETAEHVRLILGAEKILVANDPKLKSLVEVSDPREVALVKLGAHMVLQMLGEFPLDIDELKKLEEDDDGKSKHYS